MDPKKKLRLRALLKELEDYRARHTELISVYIPAGYSIVNVQQQLQQEQGTAENIKSKATRKNVQAALERMIRHLRLYKQTPENGLAIFSGNISEKEGDMNIEVWGIEPPEPINIRVYRCDQSFFLEPLKEIMQPKSIYGLIVMDNQEGNIALLKGTRVEPVKNVDSFIPGKHHKGGQCLVEESLIQLANGEIVTIKDLGSKVQAINLTNFTDISCNVVDKWNVEKEEVYEIVTKCPKTKIKCSKDHLFLIRRDNIEEVPASQLMVGDYLLAPEELNIEGKPQKLDVNDCYDYRVSKEGRELVKQKRISKGLSQKQLGKLINVHQACVSSFERGKLNLWYSLKQICSVLNIDYEQFLMYKEPNSKIKLPEVIDEKLAQLIGYFLGDGNIDTNRLCFYEQRKGVAEYYAKLATDLFSTKCTVRFRKSKNYYNLRVYGKPIYKLFKKEFSNKQSVSKKILKSPKNIVAAFLKGLFDAEGYVSSKVAIGMNNELIIKQLQLMFLRFGILSSVYEYDNKRNPYSNNIRYTLELCDKDSYTRFSKIIGFTAERKNEAVHILINKKADRSYTRQLLYSGKIIWNIVKKHGLNTSAFPKMLTGGFFRGEKQMSKTIFEKSVLGSLSECALKEELRKLLEHKVIPAKIKEINHINSPTKMIDISTEAGNFIANGLIVHNSAARMARARIEMTHDFYKKFGGIVNEALGSKPEIKGIIVGGPGPTKEAFVNGDFMHTEIKKKVIAIQDIGYTGEQGLDELVMKSKDILAKEEIAQEKAAVNHFLETLNKRPSFVAYGEDEVKKAIDLGAVDILLISEKIDAKKAEELATKIENFGGKWMSISKESKEGAQIDSLGGLAAVLRYPIEKSS